MAEILQLPLEDPEMKFTIKINLSAFSLLAGLSSLSLGNTSTTEAVNHPCRKIESACTAAGFIKRHHKEGKGLWKDCMEPLMNGKTVTGVTVDPSDIQACQAKRAARKK